MATPSFSSEGRFKTWLNPEDPLINKHRERALDSHPAGVVSKYLLHVKEKYASSGKTIKSIE
jgi:hypothetical protein